MTTAELANFVAPYLCPAREVVAHLPTKHTVEDITSPATKASLAALEAKFAAPSKRTYYLGRTGRVSQRKQLVGEVIATVRAFTTDHARYLFSDYETMRTYPVSVPKPFIGEAVLCKCGWHHAKKAECPVCANWKHIGQQIVAGEAEA